MSKHETQIQKIQKKGSFYGINMQKRPCFSSHSSLSPPTTAGLVALKCADLTVVTQQTRRRLPTRALLSSHSLWWYMASMWELASPPLGTAGSWVRQTLRREKKKLFYKLERDSSSIELFIVTSKPLQMHAIPLSFFFKQTLLFKFWAGAHASRPAIVSRPSQREAWEKRGRRRGGRRQRERRGWRERCANIEVDAANVTWWWWLGGWWEEVWWGGWSLKREGWGSTREEGWMEGGRWCWKAENIWVRIRDVTETSLQRPSHCQRVCVCVCEGVSCRPNTTSLHPPLISRPCPRLHTTWSVPVLCGSILKHRYS